MPVQVQPPGSKGRSVALALRSSTRAPDGMNCAASSARGSLFFFDGAPDGTGGGSSRARLLLMCRFIAPCRGQAGPSTCRRINSSNESLPRFAVNRADQKNLRRRLQSAPEIRPRLLQNAAEADGTDLAGQARCIVGFDRERT